MKSFRKIVWRFYDLKLWQSYESHATLDYDRYSKLKYKQTQMAHLPALIKSKKK